MTLYSHSKTDSLGITTGIKELKSHVKGVKEKSLTLFTKGLNLGFSDCELERLVTLIATFHDFGKYTSFFQDYLLKKKEVNQDLKRHAQIGCIVAYNYLIVNAPKKARLALYLIALHHRNLMNITSLRDMFDQRLRDIVEAQINDLKEIVPIVEQELSLENLNSYLHYVDESEIGRGYKIWSVKNASIQDYFLINYLFSLQIEADKLDASDTELYTLKPIDPITVDRRFGYPKLFDKELTTLTNNELRNHCRAVVVSHIDESDILENFLFTLTAPTGIGKTMTALDFALKLKSKIKAEKGFEARIIYALPFINIIEQALQEYNETLKNEEIRVLAHYQYADIFGIKDKDKNRPNEGLNYNQKLMTLDTWQSDIVITSFVQFFETLIGNRNKLLKKFSHYANAIIILDEIQTLSLEYLPLLGSVLYYLSKFLNSRVVLMTATRPKIFELAQREIVKSPIRAKELLTNNEEIFSLFNRTTIHPLLNELKQEGDERTREFVEKIFAKKWGRGLSALIVVNTVRQSIDLYEELRSFLDAINYNNPLYYLSTNIIPRERMNRIAQISTSLKNGDKPILVATQVVEAGVDLDFNIGFRDIGPIDSVIQVAGRVNRNNHPNKNHSPLYIVDFNEQATIRVYGVLTYSQSKKALSQQLEFREQDYLKLVNSYFKDIADRHSFAKSRHLFKSMELLKYNIDNENNLPISSFRIIEESNFYQSVFIEIDTEAKSLAEKYFDKITGEITVEEYNRNYKLAFHQHVIAVPHYLCDELSTINEYEEDILLVSLSELNLFYSEETGFIREKVETNISYTF